MATSEGFPPGALTFLRGLKTHNERVWFEAHREQYERDVLEPAKDFVLDLQSLLKKVSPRVRAEPRVNGSIGRLNRDLRFTKDKRPYKDHLTLWLWEGSSREGDTGYYLVLRPPTIGIGAGSYHFKGTRLERYRAAAAHPVRGAKLARIVASLRRKGYTIGGASLKRVPAPYPRTIRAPSCSGTKACTRGSRCRSAQRPWAAASPSAASPTPARWRRWRNGCSRSDRWHDAYPLLARASRGGDIRWLIAARS